MKTESHSYPQFVRAASCYHRQKKMNAMEAYRAGDAARNGVNTLSWKN